jgi:hypothetical protein
LRIETYARVWVLRSLIRTPHQTTGVCFIS